MDKQCTYMIHACNNRKWYVEQYLIPSLMMQGIDLDHIILWLDKDNLGCLESCMRAFQSVPEIGSIWHLQDDIIISSTFKQETENHENDAPIVCGYCYFRTTQIQPGRATAACMWYSFPCIKIDNKIAKECAEWYFTKGRYDQECMTYVSTGKFDDTIFKIYLERTYKDKPIVYNLKPNLVDHVDYLIGGSTVNTEREKIVKKTPAAYFEEQEKIEKLDKQINNDGRNMRVAAYCGTRNLYQGMIPAVKSLLVNSNVDKIYLLIEDDEFPYPLPKEVEAINVSGQAFFKKDGPNMNSRFTYMAMMRAALPFVLPQYDKVLSLDIDTIVVQDISELWDIDLKDNYFAAVLEPDRCVGGKYYKNNCRLYYNAGVVMYNLKQLRDRKGMEVIRSLNNRHWPFLEQDCMCELCEDRILTISNDYNCTNYSDYPICGRSFDPKIVHYAAISDWQRYPEVIQYRDMKISDGEFTF